MRKLAKEAGLVVATLYNLYGVREEILDAPSWMSSIRSI
jgi:AcrR family transcriptional regulator